MEPSTKRVLVVEDDIDTRRLIVDILEDDGLTVRACADGDQALGVLRTEPFDLVLADIKMPHRTGTELLFEMRHQGLDTPVILMTAYASVETAVQALRGSAYDYLIKPFTLKDLRDRVSRALESPGLATRAHTVLQYKDLTLDEDAHKVWQGNREIILTRLEFSVLAHLMKCQGRTVRTDELLEYVWKIGGPEERSPTTVKSCIFRLREKIEQNPHEPRYIRNVWGVGYQFGD